MLRLMKFFQELRILFCCIIGSMKSLLWSSLMVFFCLYMVGLYLTTRYYVFLRDLGEKNTTLSNSGVDQVGLIEMGKKMGSVSKCMISLFMAVTGGMDWIDLYDLLQFTGYVDQALLVCFIVFVLFGLGNLVTGIFVENAFAASKQDREIQLREQISSQERFMKDLIDLFTELDVNKSDSLSFEEFNEHLDDERALAYFESIKLDVTEAPMIFNLVDLDNSGTVDIDEFVAGFDRLRGEARALDGAIIRLLLENLDYHFRQFSSEMRESVNDIRKANGLTRSKRSSADIPSVQSMKGLYAAPSHPMVSQAAMRSPVAPVSPSRRIVQVDSQPHFISPQHTQDGDASRN